LVQSGIDPTTSGGISTVLASYTSLPGAAPTVIGPVGLDLSRNLLVGIATNSASVGPASLNLYDVTSLSAPIALAAYTFPQSPYKDNKNCIGQCFFAGDYVFAICGNNGVMAYKVVVGPPTPPAFLVQPRNLQLVEASAGTMSVTLDQTAAYQWQKGGTNISGATASSYTISPAQLSDAANYRCVASNFFGMNTSSVAVVTVRALADVYHLTPTWGLGPLSRPYLVADSDSKGQTPLYRSIACNSLSNQIYVISRTNATAGLTINVLDASTGADLYQLDTTGIAGGSIVLLAMGVADDGSLYAGNMSYTTPADFLLYRWANSAPATSPTLVYSGEPANQTSSLRWGDNLDVRGAGTNTEILVDAYQGTFAAILKPTDSSLGSFTSSFFTESTPSSPIGRSLQFATGNRAWQKRSGKDLQLYAYDLPTQTGTLLSNYTGLPASIGPVALDVSRNLLAGINIAGVSTNAPDTLALYDITDLSAPLLIATYNFPSNALPNKNMVGQVLFAGDRVYALDGNNGIVAFSIIAPAKPQLNVGTDGSKVILSWPSFFTGYTLYSASAAVGPHTNPEGPGVAAGNYYWVTNTLSGTQKYYRLQK
ncbi:MAG: immunoglobulin domain-containing protein, partial [Verrucomicrobia bacterium]|nr:immunoglobulin domain-containing protein [Verrucomicrobiota bacterium]